MVRAGATRAPARGVTDLAIGSSDWLGVGITLPEIMRNKEANAAQKSRITEPSPILKRDRTTSPRTIDFIPTPDRKDKILTMLARRRISVTLPKMGDQRFFKVGPIPP